MPTRQPWLQLISNFRDRSSIGHVASSIATSIHTKAQQDLAVWCMTGQRPEGIQCGTARLLDSAEVTLFIGWPAQARRILGRYKRLVGLYVCEGDTVPTEWAEVCNRHHAIIVPSAYCAEAFKAGGVTVPVHVVQHGFSPRFRVEGPVHTQVGPTVGVLAALNAWYERKGVAEMAEAWERFVIAHPDWRIEWRTTPCPDWTGRIIPNWQWIVARDSQSDLAAWYRGLTALAMPSRGEGFGLTGLEALACGTPIIAPLHSGLAEYVQPDRDCIVEHGGLVSMATFDNAVGKLHDITPAALLDALERFAADTPWWKMKAQSFPRHEWTWDVMAGRILRILQGVRSMAAQSAPLPEALRPKRIHGPANTVGHPLPPAKTAQAQPRGATWYPPYRRRPLVLIIGQTLGLGGGEKVTVDFVRALHDSGLYQVELAMSLVSQGLHRRAIPAGIPVHDVPTPGALIDLAKRIKPNAYLVNNCPMPKTILRSLADGNPDYIGYIVHGFVPWSLNILPSPFPSYVSVIAISEGVRQGLLSARNDIHPAQVVTIANGVDCERFRPEGPKVPLPWPSDAIVFGYAGRLSGEKALPTMVECFARARATIPTAKLLIVGGADPDGPKDHVVAWNSNEAELRQAIAKHGLQDHVWVTGAVPDPERYYRSMNVLLLTSVFEGLPLVVLEAMASGVPVVSTAVGCVAQLLASGGGTAVASGSGAMPEWAKHAFVKAMIEVATNPRDIGQSGRAEVLEHYSSARHSEGVLNYFKGMVSRPVKVAALYDVEGYAFHRISSQIQTGMPGAEVTLVQYSSLAPGSLSGFDVVFNPSYIQTDAIVAAKRPDAPLVSSVPDHFTWKSGWGLGQFQTAMKASAVMVCTNEAMLAEVKALYPNVRLALAWSGVDADFFCPDPDKPKRKAGEPLRVGWAGSTKFWRDVKGVDLVIDACKAVPGVELVLVDATERLRTPEEMREFYRSLDVYVCMSSSEGTCLPLLEAAACGVALVSTDVGVAGALLTAGKAGTLVDRSVPALAKALKAASVRRARTVDQGLAARAEIVDNGWAWAERAKVYGETIMGALDA